MAHHLLLPKLGLTMTEGVLSEWLVCEGAAFKTGDALFVVESEKVATEVLAENDGTLAEILVQAGEEAEVGAVVGYWSDSSAETVVSQSETTSAKDDSMVVQPAPEPTTSVFVEPIISNEALDIADDTGERIVSTPFARRTAEQRGIALESVTGSGPGGRIKAADVEMAARQQDRVTDSGAAASPLPAGTVSTTSLASGSIDLGVRSKPDSVRAAIARRLTHAKQTVPHFYMSVDVRADALLGLHTELNNISAVHRITLTHFVVAAVGRALREFPQANRTWSDGEIVTFDSTDVGVAINTEHGLFAPVVRDAGNASLREVSQRVQSLVAAARAGRLSQDDSLGGSISVSNAGMYNVKYLTPIINPGQAMILGVGGVNRIFRPDNHGQPVLSQEIGLVLASDHRILDGVSGLGFLNCVVSYLEHPLKLMVGN